MIKVKKQICVDCGEHEFIFSKGRCKGCASKSYGGLTSFKRNMSKFNPKSREKRKEERACLKEFFEYHITQLRGSRVSIEDGERIPVPTSLNIAHIFPKSRYKSVQCLQENAIYLTVDQHSRFDRLLGELDFDQLEKEFPNSWGITCNKVKNILPLLEEQGKLRNKFENYVYKL